MSNKSVESKPVSDGMECPMCGGSGLIYDITDAINAAETVGTVMVPLAPSEIDPTPIQRRVRDARLRSTETS